MVSIKGLDIAIADKLGTYVTMASDKPFELLLKLRADPKFSGTFFYFFYFSLLDNNFFFVNCYLGELAQEAFVELELLFKYLTAMGRISSISFDLSLARGLDYYTGCVYEAVFTNDSNRIGSIAAGKYFHKSFFLYIFIFFLFDL